LRFETFGDVLTSGMSILMLSVTPGLLLTFAYLLKTGYEGKRLASQAFKERFGALTEDVNTATALGAFWTLYMLIRWTLTILVLLLFRQTPAVQILLLFGLSVVT
jgi:hypothetical protein